MIITIQLNLYNGHLGDRSDHCREVAVSGDQSTVFMLMTMIMIMIILKGTSDLRPATYL